MRTFGFIFLLTVSFLSLSAQNLKPYVIGFKSSESIMVVQEKVIQNLEQNELQIVGQYQPAKNDKRWVIIFTANELNNAVQKVGGLTGFAATLRIAITREGDKTVVSYTHPMYWGNAYFREDFKKVNQEYKTVNTLVENAMKASGNFDGTPFGSEKGISVNELQTYRYMMGMPRFDSTIELEDFDSYKAAVSKIDASIGNKVPNLKKVYKHTIPGKELTLYGFALEGADGEESFLPTIDINTPKHTAFLPYEVLVIGNEVHMLHGRYRIAIAFPDLTMGTFSKIMSTPGNIEELLEQLVE